MKNNSISVETQRRWLQGEHLKSSVKSGSLKSYPPQTFQYVREGNMQCDMQSYAYFFRCVLTIVQEGSFVEAY